MSRTIRSSRLSLIGFGMAVVGIVIVLAAQGSTAIGVLGISVVLLGVGAISKGVPGKTWSSGGSHGTGPAHGGAMTKEPHRTAPLVTANDPAKIIRGADYLVPALGELTTSFLSWLEQHHTRQDLWPALDRWMRDTLNQFLQARRVRCFRVADDGHRLVLMGGGVEKALWFGTPPSLVDHAVKTGNRFIAGAPDNGELIKQLVSEWRSESAGQDGHRLLADVPAWLLPIRSRNKTIGLLVVGELPADTLRDLPTLQAVGHLIELYWCHVDQAYAIEVAQRTDQTSGVLNRTDLAATARQAVQRSVLDDEPTVILAVSIEGLRRLDDKRRWEDRDWLIGQVGLAMREKLRSDDIVGRFNDDCFVAILRRLDVSLGKLIAGKLLESARKRFDDQPDLKGVIGLRCALSEVGSDEFETLLGRTLEALQRARQEHTDILVVAPERAVADGTLIRAGS